MPAADTSTHAAIAATILFNIDFPSSTDALANRIRYQLIER